MSISRKPDKSKEWGNKFNIAQKKEVPLQFKPTEAYLIPEVHSLIQFVSLVDKLPDFVKSLEKKREESIPSKQYVDFIKKSSSFSYFFFSKASRSTNNVQYRGTQWREEELEPYKNIVHAVLLPLGRGGPTHITWYPEFDTPSIFSNNVKLDSSVKAVLGDLTKDPSDDEDEGLSESMSRTNSQGSKDLQQAKVGATPKKRTLSPPMAPIPETGKKTLMKDDSDDDMLPLESQRSESESSSRKLWVNDSQGDVHGFLPRSPLKSSRKDMLAHLQKAYELDPAIHNRVVQFEEKKLQQEDKVLLEFTLRVILIDHNYFYPPETFQSEEAFENWKGFAKHDLLHCISGFNTDLRYLMASGQNFLKNMRRTSFTGKFILNIMPASSNPELDEKYADLRDFNHLCDWHDPFRFVRVDKPVQELRIQIWDEDRVAEPLYFTRISNSNKIQSLSVTDYDLESEKNSVQLTSSQPPPASYAPSPLKPGSMSKSASRDMDKIDKPSELATETTVNSLGHVFLPTNKFTELEGAIRFIKPIAGLPWASNLHVHINYQWDKARYYYYPPNYHEMYETLLRRVYNLDLMLGGGNTQHFPSIVSASILEEFRFRYGILQIYHDIVELRFFGSRFISADPNDTRLLLASLENANSLVLRDLKNFNLIEREMILEVLSELRIHQVEKISHYRDCFPTGPSSGAFQVNIEILGLVVIMLGVLNPELSPKPFPDVLTDCIQANSVQIGKRCRALTDIERQNKNPNFIVNLFTMLFSEIDADKNFYGAEASVLPVLIPQISISNYREMFATEIAEFIKEAQITRENMLDWFKAFYVMNFFNNSYLKTLKIQNLLPITEWFEKLFTEFIELTRDKTHRFFEQYYDIQKAAANGDTSIFYQLAVVSQWLEKAMKFVVSLQIRKESLLHLLVKIAEGICSEAMIFSANLSMFVSTYNPPKNDNILGMVANWSPFKIKGSVGVSAVKFDFTRLRPAIDPQLCHILNHIEVTSIQIDRLHQFTLTLISNILTKPDNVSHDETRENIQTIFVSSSESLSNASAELIREAANQMKEPIELHVRAIVAKKNRPVPRQNSTTSPPSKATILQNQQSEVFEDIDQEVEKTLVGLLNYLVPNIDFLCSTLYSKVFIQTLYRLWVLLMGEFRAALKNSFNSNSTSPTNSVPASSPPNSSTPIPPLISQASSIGLDGYQAKFLLRSLEILRIIFHAGGNGLTPESMNKGGYEEVISLLRQK